MPPAAAAVAVAVVAPVHAFAWLRRVGGIWLVCCSRGEMAYNISKGETNHFKEGKREGKSHHSASSPKERSVSKLSTGL